MLKKRVLTVSLSLLACLCCCFSGFGSVNAYAFTLPIDGYLFYNATENNMRLRVYNNNTDTDLIGVMNNQDIQFKNANFENDVAFSNVLGFRYSFSQSSALFEFPFDFNNYDYYSSLTIVNNGTNTGFDFTPTSFSIVPYVDGALEFINLSDLSVLSAGGSSSDGFTVIGKIPDNIDSSYIYGFRVLGTSGSVVAGDYIVNAYIWQLPKGDEYTNADVITAINNQTNQLSTDIGQAADDVQQSIEDQYQMEDEEDFGFSDIQQEYEEKMGVLTFGTETTIQMLELFSPSNADEAYIRVPGWTMEVQGETYQIWDEYVFYFDSIEENFPFLVTTMRTFTVAMFYVAIVGYITKVYERNFLAK